MIWQQAPLSCAQTKLRVLLAASLQPSFSGAGVAEWLDEGQEGQRQGSRLADPRPSRAEHCQSASNTTTRKHTPPDAASSTPPSCSQAGSADPSCRCPCHSRPTRSGAASSRETAHSSNLRTLSHNTQLSSRTISDPSTTRRASTTQFRISNRLGTPENAPRQLHQRASVRAVVRTTAESPRRSTGICI